MNSKAKGSEFERRIANMIRDELGLSRDEAFRTPMSGAHFALGTGVDIQLSGKALERFPFAVECKHVRTWTPSAMLQTPLRRQEEMWLRQVVQGASSTGLMPVLIMSGHRTDIWAATYDDGRLAVRAPRVHFLFDGRSWIMVLFREFLRAVKSYSVSGGASWSL